MNGIVSLCQFCEVHGPSIILSTQACRNHNHIKFKGNRKYYGPPESLRSTVNPALPSCEACQSVSSNCFVSSDHDAHTSFISSQLPWQSELEGLVRQACTRSLSCEVSPGKEGILVFSDDLGQGAAQGSSVLSHTFLIRDSLARGFHRWFSIIVLTKDRLLLLNLWPFLEKNISAFVLELQMSAKKVYDAEQTSQSQRSLRLSNSHCADRSSRPLPQLTGLPNVFAQLHLWFAWLLQNAAICLRETLPFIESPIPFAPLEEHEDGVTFVSAINTIMSTKAVPDAKNPVTCILKTGGPCVSSLKTLRSLLGPTNFASIVYCLLIGRQVIVRGQPAVLVASILFTLKTLLPRGCVRLIPFSSHYVTPSDCNMLGIGAHVAVPQPSQQVARLEIVTPPDFEPNEALSHVKEADLFSYHLKWQGQLPPKWPSFLSKLERALQSEILSESALVLQIGALRMETFNAARVLYHLDNPDRKETCDPRDKTALFQALGVNSSDADVLSFWSKSYSLGSP